MTELTRREAFLFATESLSFSEAAMGVISLEVNDEGIECQQFFEDRIILIVPSNFSWEARFMATPANLLEVPFILRESTSGTRRVLLAELAK